MLELKGTHWSGNGVFLQFFKTEIMTGKDAGGHEVSCRKIFLQNSLY